MVCVSLQQCDYDQLLVNLQMEGTCVKEAMRINWRAEVSLIVSWQSNYYSVHVGRL